MSAPGFTSGNGTVRTVDILPADFQVWTHRGSKLQPEQIAAGLDSMIHTMVQSELAELGYDVIAHLDWDGTYAAGPGGLRRAMAADDLAATMLSLSTFGTAQARAGNRLLIPHLPAKLGQRTGSDATLYVGGWAYAGHDNQTSTGTKVAIGVLAAVLVVGIIVLAVSGGKGGGKVLGGVGKGLAKAGSGVAKAAGGFGRAAGTLVRATAKGIVRTGIIITRHGPRIALETLDAFGRAGMVTHIHVQPMRVDYAQSKQTPHKGPSAMLFEMTLIDNHTGRVLWHARRRFPASPRKSGQVAKAIRRMVDNLPSVNGEKTVLAQHRAAGAGSARAQWPEATGAATLAP